MLGRAGDSSKSTEERDERTRADISIDSSPIQSSPVEPIKGGAGCQLGNVAGVSYHAVHAERDRLGTAIRDRFPSRVWAAAAACEGNTVTRGILLTKKPFALEEFVKERKVGDMISLLTILEEHRVISLSTPHSLDSRKLWGTTEDPGPRLSAVSKLGYLGYCNFLIPMCVLALSHRAPEARAKKGNLSSSHANLPCECFKSILFLLITSVINLFKFNILLLVRSTLGPGRGGTRAARTFIRDQRIV